MAKILKTVEASSELICYIQKLYYDLEGYRTIVQNIILGTGEFAYNKEIYELHMKKYLEANAEYRLAISEIMDIYASEYEDRTNMYPLVEFNSETIKIMDSEGEDSCYLKTGK